MVAAETNMIALVLRLFCILKGVYIYLVHYKNQVHNQDTCTGYKNYSMLRSSSCNPQNHNALDYNH